MANLFLLTGSKKGERLSLTKSRTFLGREPGCDIVIDETMVPADSQKQKDSVSRKHAIICYVGGTYCIEDGDGQGNLSRNSTYVNEKKVFGRLPLRHNDRIRICNFVCTFQKDAEAPIAVETAIDHESSIQSMQSQPADKLRFILEISNSLSTTLDLEALLPQIVDHLFQLYPQAERGFIFLGTQASEPLVVRAFKTRRTDEEADDRFSASIVRRCLEKMEGLLGNDLVQQFPDSKSVVELPMRSLMCAPLRSLDGKGLGAIQLDTRGSKSRFNEEDLKLLLGVASQASIAMCNAGLHRDLLELQLREVNLEMANQVQLALLPQQLPAVSGYQFYAYYRAAQKIGGDYYDFIPLPGSRLAVLLGDVEGKGVAAALVMAKFSVEARVCLEAEPDLAAAVSKLNAVMVRAAVAERFVSLAAVVLDPATHTATLVNAGHPSPLLIRHATGQVEQAAPAEVAGPLIGTTPGQAYASCAVQFRPGDSLLLFSDGVTDAHNTQDRRFGLKGIYDVLESGRFFPRETGERLIQAVNRHALGCAPFDDITLVCFGRQ